MGLFNNSDTVLKKSLVVLPQFQGDNKVVEGQELQEFLLSKLCNHSTYLLNPRNLSICHTNKDINANWDRLWLQSRNKLHWSPMMKCYDKKSKRHRLKEKGAGDSFGSKAQSRIAHNTIRIVEQFCTY